MKVVLFPFSVAVKVQTDFHCSRFVYKRGIAEDTQMIASLCGDRVLGPTCNRVLLQRTHG